MQGRCKVCHMTVSCKFNTGHFVRHLQLAHREVYLSYQNKMQSNWTRSQLERSLKWWEGQKKTGSKWSTDNVVAETILKWTLRDWNFKFAESFSLSFFCFLKICQGIGREKQVASFVINWRDGDTYISPLKEIENFIDVLKLLHNELMNVFCRIPSSVLSVYCKSSEWINKHRELFIFFLFRASYVKSMVQKLLLRLFS